MNLRAPVIGPVVYYVRRRDHVKIGHTVDLRRRIREMKAWGSVLAIEPGSRITELERHAEFAADRVDRQPEQFRASPRLMAHIAQLNEVMPVPHDALRPRPRRGAS